MKIEWLKLRDHLNSKLEFEFKLNLNSNGTFRKDKYFKEEKLWTLLITNTIYIVFTMYVNKRILQ